MRNISLLKLSAVVVSASMASFFVSADEVSITSADKKPAQVQTQEKSGVEKIAFSALDTNKDGKLSKQEVSVSQNQLLAQAFSKIDLNADDELTQDELDSYIVAANK